MPVVPSAVRDRISASATRRTRSVNVAIMNFFIKPRAAEHTVGDELGRHDEVERRDDAQERNACIHCLPRGALKEDVYKWLPGEHIKCHQRHAQRPDEFDTSPKAGLDAIIFAGPEVLRRIVGNAVAERGKGRDNHVVELHRRRVARHDGSSKAVDDALDDDVADGNKALLQDARNGDDREPSKMVPRENASRALRSGAFAKRRKTTTSASTQLTPWHKNVAHATPATPISNAVTNRISTAMFDVDEQARKINGVLESPSAEKMPVATL